MADFKKAQIILEKIEGGYVHDPLDRGGETLNGIARKFFPDWNGWKVVDELKKKSANLAELKSTLKNDSKLPREIELFYKEHFWDKMKLDSINSDVVAQNIYLIGVNAGISRSIKTAQKVSGVVVDGKIGPKTIEAINNMNENDFKKAFDAEEIAHYNSIVQKNPSQERFFKGWLNRANLV